jgi:hypothetical protein
MKIMTMEKRKIIKKKTKVLIKMKIRMMEWFGIE